MALPNPFNAIWDAIRSAKAQVLIALIGVIGTDQIVNMVKTGKLTLGGPPDWLAQDVLAIIGQIEQDIGGPLFEALVAAPTGISDLGAPGNQEHDAVVMIKRMLGFGMALPLLAGELELPMKALLGDNLGSKIFEAIKDMPHELGINFFLGTVMEEIFSTAVRAPLEEAIAEKSRPARLEWPQLRALARTHVMSDDQLNEFLRRAGFRDQDIGFIKALDRTLLPVGDLQQAYIDGVLDEGTVRGKLNELGFNPEDIEIIVQIYLVRATTEASSTYRTVARSAFATGDISESQFRAILAQIHVPPQSIDLEVAAVSLERTVGRTHLTAAELQKLWTEGALTQGQVEQQLSSIGYDADSISELLTLWTTNAKAGKNVLTVSRVLAYFMGDVINDQEAYDLLIADGVSPQQATFLIQHPKAQTSTFAHKLSPGTIVSAYKDGVISIDDAKAKLISAGTAPDEANLQLQVAQAELAKGGKPKQSAKQLSIAEVESAVKLGLGTYTWAVRQLGVIGYSDNDALLIVAEWFTTIEGTTPDGWTVLN